MIRIAYWTATCGGDAKHIGSEPRTGFREWNEKFRNAFLQVRPQWKEEWNGLDYLARMHVRQEKNLLMDEEITNWRADKDGVTEMDLGKMSQELYAILLDKTE